MVTNSIHEMSHFVRHDGAIREKTSGRKRGSEASALPTTCHNKCFAVMSNEVRHLLLNLLKYILLTKIYYFLRINKHSPTNVSKAFKISLSWLNS
jgi:hypothetical protein